jgi:hypothetical protein
MKSLLVRALRKARRPLLYKYDQLKFLIRKHQTANPKSRRSFLENPPILDEVQQRILHELNQSGHAKADFFDLLPNSQNLWKELLESSNNLAQSQEALAAMNDFEQNGAGKNKKGKTYLYCLSERAKPYTLDLSHPLIKVATEQKILDIANSYLGPHSKLQNADIWLTMPSPVNREATYSQNWHRDRDDEKIIKVFLYFSDIDEECGPTEYIPESRLGGRYAYLCPVCSGNIPGHLVYPSPEKVEAAVPAADRKKLIGKKGTLFFLDTTGLHKGGLSFSKTRLFGYLVYVSPASLLSKRLFEIIDSKQIEKNLSYSAQYSLDTSGCSSALKDY